MSAVVLKRVLAVIVTLLATIGFLINSAGFVSTWVARRPACDTVTTVSTFVNNKLETVHQALARVNARLDESRQALARINNAINALDDRLDQGSSRLTELVSATRNELAPKMAEMRDQAAALRDAVASVNAALETIDSFGLTNVPTLGNELSTVSERVEAAQTDVQELRAAFEEAKTTGSANLVAALTTRTMKIGNRLEQIKFTAVKFQATVEQKQQLLANLSHRVLRGINLLVLSLTVLFLVVAAGQVLLIYVCWQCVRTGRFPSLRVAQG